MWFMSVAPFISIALVVFVVVILLIHFSIAPPHLRYWPLISPSQMPPGPSGALITGNLLEWLQVRPDGRKVIQWLNKQAQYGEMTTLHMGSKTWVLLNTSRVVNEIFVKRAALTHERPYLPVAGGLVSKDKRFFLSKTHIWREGRHLMHQVMTGAGSKEHGRFAEQESVSLLRACLDDPRKWYAHNYRYCIAIMYRIATGNTLEATQEELDDLQLTTSTFISSVNSSIVDFFPQLARLPKILQFWRHRWQKIGTFHYNVIQHWWKGMDHLKQTDATPSFVRDLLLPNFSGREDTAMYLAMSLITAGGDNPRMTMNAWFMSCLSAPGAMEKARQELESVCGRSAERLPCLDDLPSCPYTCAVVKEVLRWRPTVPLSPQRVLVQDLQFEGYRFPAGTEFLVNSYPCCTTGYDRPLEFLPERWLEVKEEGQRSGVAQDLWTFAFSGGRRVCVGYKLAQKELFVAYARLIYCFDIKPAGQFSDTKLNAFSAGEPFPVSLTPRSTAHESLIRKSAT